jgi:hypothetical protein
VGLVELAPNGKAHLIPITIMYDGKFYDASAYKASPVPMALQRGTVYEGLKTGVSQGLFTIKEPTETQGVWAAEGIWEAAGSTPPPKKPPAPPRKDEDLDQPPVLRHADSEPPKSSQAQPAAPPQAPQTPQTPSTPAPSPSPPLAAPQNQDQDNDKDRPVLRRGKAAAQEHELKQERATPAPTSPKPPSFQPVATSKSGSVQIIPAISDAGGPEPRPYAYVMKPEEEQAFQKKILVLAAEEVRARARQLAEEARGSAPSPRRASKAAEPKLPQPVFDNVQLRVFDLSNTNDPVLVINADARMPQRSSSATGDLQYFITLVARQDTYGQLKKAFTSITDNLHLDAIPRLELVDAVDADGDGRGELLFRKISDVGRAFNVYRVIGDQLYPLFEGTPQ